MVARGSVEVKLDMRDLVANELAAIRGVMKLALPRDVLTGVVISRRSETRVAWRVSDYNYCRPYSARSAHRTRLSKMITHTATAASLDHSFPKTSNFGPATTIVILACIDTGS